MKKTILLLSAFLIASSAVFAGSSPKKPKKVKMKNQIDSISYAIGVAIGKDMTKQLAKITESKENKKLIIKGFSTAINGDTTAFSFKMADSLVTAYMKASFDKKEKKRLDDNANFLKENAKKAGVVTLPSGLQYMVVKEGTGALPTDTNTVKVHYEGTLIDGTVFDSSIKRGEPVEFKLNQVIKGWTEGVQHMKVGSTYKLFIPAELGYGSQPVGPIPANSTLIFEVQLLDIINKK